MSKSELCIVSITFLTGTLFWLKWNSNLDITDLSTQDVSLEDIFINMTTKN